MSKGQAPKLKGALCNIPIERNDVYIYIPDILPRNPDSNGIYTSSCKT